MVFLSFGSTVLGSFIFAFQQLPSIVYFQRIIPLNVETTMMAFSTSIVNLSRGQLSQMTGVIVNKLFVGVTS